MRLIDADALAKKAYEVAYPVIHGWNDHERGLTLTGMAQLLDEAPTIDAVPVVRCRECIRWQGKDDGNAAPCSWDWYNKDPEWYCPRGKRREDGAE